MRRLGLVLLVLLSLIAVGGGCSDDEQYGDPDRTTIPRDRKGLAPGETTTTTDHDEVATVDTTARTTTTTRPITTTTRQVLEIKIQDDQQGKPFEPQLVTTRAGRLVRWINVGNTDRFVVADNNAFRSPAIKAGGGTYEWVAKTGQYNYSDGVRPYANGTLNVQ